MIKAISSKVMWVGKVTTFCVGLTVTLALILGVGTTALAAVSGDPFKLGKTNTIDEMSKLIGSASGTLLKIDNEGTGSALDLQVEPGEAPMKVDSGTKVANLNSDELDGNSANEFISEDKTYTSTELEIGTGGGVDVQVFTDCDPGDRVLGGGGNAAFLNDVLRVSEPTIDGWRVVAQDNGNGSTVVAKAICADFPPVRP